MQSCLKNKITYELFMLNVCLPVTLQLRWPRDAESVHGSGAVGEDALTLRPAGLQNSGLLHTLWNKRSAQEQPHVRRAVQISQRHELLKTHKTQHASAEKTGKNITEKFHSGPSQLEE